jgi:hypothetical protein
MIVFDLKCRNGHVFEAWFNNAQTFEGLRKGGQVACSVCGTRKVDKALQAPRISTRKGKKAAAPAPAAEPAANAASTPEKPTLPPALSGPAHYGNDPMAAKAADLMKQLSELRVQIEKNCDYVGKKFPEEARKIHYGEAPKRNIYGEATDMEARALKEEGVEFSRIPWTPRRDS